MIITYQGGRSFKVSQGELSLAINPKAKTSADVTIFTDDRGDTSDKSGFVIDGAGEYEIKGIFIKGFLGGTYLITFEGIRICLLGQTAGDELEDIDILLTSTDAYKTAVSLEPAIIIPMGYDPSTSSGQASLAQFLKEAGESGVEPLDKLVIKKKDLEGKEGEVVVLKEE